MEFITKNTQETQQAAADLVKKIGVLKHQGALVLAFQGELGAGKTTFIQGLAKALGIKEKILSPTFVIMKHFDVPGANRFKEFYHLDAYRLEGGKDLEVFNFKEILKNENNLAVIEWAERVKEILPEDTVWLEFEHGGEDRRKIKILN